MLLEERDVVQHVFLVHRAATAGVELMTVHALEHDALAVELHHAVFDGEMPEADALAADFDHCAVRTVQRQVERV